MNWNEEVVSQTVLGVPRSHWHCTLRNFDPGDLSKRDIEAVAWWMEGVRCREAPHLLLIGNIGSGKTHLAVALYRWAVRITEELAAPADNLFIHVDDLLGKLAACRWPSDQADIWADLAYPCMAVALDDLFGSKYTDTQQKQVAMLVDTLHRNDAGMIVTSNLEPSQWVERGGMAPHEMSRLAERARAIKFGGRDRRLS